MNIKTTEQEKPNPNELAEKLCGDSFKTANEVCLAEIDFIQQIFKKENQQ